jgi:large subunit ribosomal protein L9e
MTVEARSRGLGQIFLFRLKLRTANLFKASNLQFVDQPFLFVLEKKSTEKSVKMKHILQTRDVNIPEGVTLRVKARQIQVKGPRGELTKNFKHVDLDIQKLSDRKLRVKVWHGARKHIACIRTSCSHIENMIKGVTKGFEYKMRLAYAHFPINAVVTENGKMIEIRNFLGEKIVRRVQMLDGVTVSISSAQKDELILVGNDIQNVSQSGELFFIRAD